MERPSNSVYTSVIKRWGKPILPPLMTEERRKEMLEYRHLAEVVELRLKRKKVRQYLKSKISDLFEKFRDMHSTSSMLISIGEQEHEVNSQKSSNLLYVIEDKQQTNEITTTFSSLLNVDAPLVEFQIIPSVVECPTANILHERENVSSEHGHDNVNLVSPSDIDISVDSDSTSLRCSLTGSHLSSNSAIKDKCKTFELSEIFTFVPTSSTIKVQGEQDLTELHSNSIAKHVLISNNSSVAFSTSENTGQIMVKSNTEEHAVNNEIVCEKENCLQDDCENEDPSKSTNLESDFSPSSRLTANDSETSLRAVTPSTDLEKYMDSSAETPTYSTSKSPESLDCSLATEFSSKSEDVTVINLSSGTTTPVIGDDMDKNRFSTYVLKDVLNVAGGENSHDSESGVSSPNKRMVRRNSYTLENPSPALVEALEKNRVVGPSANEKMKNLPLALNFNEALFANDRHSNGEAVKKVVEETELAERRSRISPQKDYLHQPRNSATSKPGVVVNTTEQHSIFSGKPVDQVNHHHRSKESMKSFANGILHYSEQQISMLQEKHKQLRNYLNLVSERATLTNQKEIDLAQNDLPDQEIVMPMSMIRRVMLQQEERLNELRQQLIEEHHQQMTALFEQQQLQWQNLVALIQNQNDANLLALSANSESFRIHTLQVPSVESVSSKNTRRNGGRVLSLPILALDPIMKPKFDRVSAAAKGYLTRRLMRSDKVQAIIQTIRDTVECALALHADLPQRENCVTEQDAFLHQRLIVQLNAACHEFHDVFFSLSTSEKMALIAQTRNSSFEKSRKIADGHSSPGSYISSATLKVLARKHNSPLAGQARKRSASSPVLRSHSCLSNRHSPQNSRKSPIHGRTRSVNRKVKKVSTKSYQ